MIKTSHHIKNAISLVRADDWRLSFLPFIMGSVYLWIWWFKITLSISSLFIIILSFITTIGFASLGYLINEFFDQEFDSRAGKMNKLSSLNYRIIVLLFLVSSSCTLLPWLWLPFDKLSWLLIIFQILLFLCYSIPFIRFKEHSIFSIITDSLYAYLVPIILSFYTFSLFSDQLKIPFWFYFFMLNVFFVGVRNIIIHQIKDILKDKTSGLTTIPMILGIKKTYQLLFIISLYEGFFFLAFLNTLFLFLKYTFIISILCYIILCFVWVKKHYNKEDDKVYLKLNYVYHVLFPLCSALLMIYFNYHWALVLILHMVLLVPASFYSKIISFIKRICSVLMKIILVDVRNAISLVVNLPIYWTFRLFGVNLKKEQTSAIAYFKKHFINL